MGYLVIIWTSKNLRNSLLILNNIYKILLIKGTSNYKTLMNLNLLKSFNDIFYLFIKV